MMTDCMTACLARFNRKCAPRYDQDGDDNNSPS